ncbi:MAG: hypothetical protein ACYC9X_08080 [Dehalococcoidia bacterium]
MVLALTIPAAVTFAGCRSGRAASVVAPTPNPTVAQAYTLPHPDLTPAPYPRGAIGYAVSWPQCGGAYPRKPFDFAIVAVTGGRAFYPNPCLAEQYQWARRGRDYLAFYMNTNFDAASHPHLIRELRLKCGDNAACAAYLYGASAARQAHEHAAVVGAHAPMWWLDVQIVSTWSPRVDLNAAAIKGAIDYLAGQGVRVGISSTPYQWKTVVGSYAPGLPGWVAGAPDQAQAVMYCDGRQDFGGGRTEQIAYVANGYEMVRACGLSTRRSSPRVRREAPP